MLDRTRLGAHDQAQRQLALPHSVRQLLQSIGADSRAPADFIPVLICKFTVLTNTSCPTSKFTDL